MADVRDILGVPRGQAADRQEAPKTKEKVQRPAGMSREAFALLGGSYPIVPSQLTYELRKKEDLKGLKEKRKNTKGQVRPQAIHPCTPCNVLPAQLSPAGTELPCSPPPLQICLSQHTCNSSTHASKSVDAGLRSEACSGKGQCRDGNSTSYMYMTWDCVR